MSESQQPQQQYQPPYQSYQTNYGYANNGQVEHKVNVVIAIIMFFLLGLISVLGYYIYAKDPENTSKQIIAGILIIGSLLLNLFLLGII